MSEEYVYRELDSPGNFRLFTVLPAEFNEPLAGTLSEHAPRLPTPTYEALSYAWGNRSENEHGVALDRKWLGISHELEVALRNLRQTSESRTIWVDAICINQADTDERNSQVAMMQDIYRSAKRVVAWIGLESSDSDQAMALLAEIAEHNEGNPHRSLPSRQPSPNQLPSSETLTDTLSEEQKWQSYKRKWNIEVSPDNRHKRSHLVTGQPELYATFEGDNEERFYQSITQNEWESLDRFLERPWWSRTWVVQEVWHSTQTMIQCGKSTLEWNVFACAMAFYESWDELGSYVKDTPRWASWNIVKRRYGLATHIAKQRLLGCGLLDLLWNMWDREATDPRDKVFAVLNLVADEDRAALPRADYSKSLREVYREVAVYSVQKEKNLDVLLAASGVLGPQNGLPSWVPDWRKGANDARSALFINGSTMRGLLYNSGSTDMVMFHGHGFTASGYAEAIADFDLESDTLQVGGLVLDTIKSLGPAYGGDLGDYSTVISEAEEVINGHTSTESAIKFPPAAETNSISILTAGFLESVDEEPGQIICNIMKHRRFFATRGGHFCVGPALAQADDVVTIIAGCSFPILLRPEGGHYTVVGEVYVPNYMAGEALRGPGSSEPSEKPNPWESMVLR